MNEMSPRRMKVPEFLEWAMAQERGRYELIDGRIHRLLPERARHNLNKGRIRDVLRAAVETAGLACTVWGDGMAVPVDDANSREPDCMVTCGGEIDLDTLTIDDPVIIIETVSRWSQRRDKVKKRNKYFGLPSLRDYLVIDEPKGLVMHWRRAGNGKIVKRELTEGEITLDPPGLTVKVPDLLSLG